MNADSPEITTQFMAAAGRLLATVAKEVARGGESTLRDRLAALVQALSAGLVDREAALRLCLCAALAGEHVVFLGPPGTAKSLLARRLKLAVKDARFFERLLTKFTVPEELFGPFSIRALENDRYERQIERYMPTAEICFLDEVFKANAAILNTLLQILNEREFDNGPVKVRCPLVTMVAASNEMPEADGNLGALYDRFLFRELVGYVDDAHFDALLDAGEDTPIVDAALPFSLDELESIRAEAVRCTWSPEARTLFRAFRAWSLKNGLSISDRRWRKIQKVVKVIATSEGRMAVLPVDLTLLPVLSWERPEQREIIGAWLTSQLAAVGDLGPITAEIVACETKLRRWEAEAATAAQTAGSGAAPTPPAPGLRFVAPADACDNFYSPVSLDNGGQGYLVRDLGKLHVRNGTGYALFQDMPNFATYLANPAHRLGATPTTPAPAAATGPLSTQAIGAMGTVQDLLQKLDRYGAHLENQAARLRATPIPIFGVPATLHDAMACIVREQSALSPLRGRVHSLASGLTALASG